jgi:CheY-like chemotaxis protein
MRHSIGHPLAVLIVEDEEDTARSTAELVTLCGHVARIAASGPEALRECAAGAPDVVLLDIGLPGMDGWKLAEELRQRTAGRQPVIVAVTGHAGELDRWNSADAGVDLHLVKPADPAVLARLLNWIGGLLAAGEEPKHPPE